MSPHHRRAHPRGRSLSRRDFLRRSAGAAVALPSFAAILAACQDRAADPGSGGNGATTSLARPDNPVTLALTDDNPPIDDGLSPEAGPLRIFNWNDYVYKKVLKRFEDEFGVEIEYTPFTTMSEAISKIQNDAVEFDLFFPTVDHLGDLVAAKKVQPLNVSYLPNMTANAWPQLLDPFYDKGGRYTAPYLTWTTGIGYRRDMVASEPSGDFISAYDPLWDPQYRGQVGTVDEYRDTIAMALLHAGFDDVNTEDPAEIERARDDLLDMVERVAVNTSLPDYQALGEGIHAVQYNWSGNMNYTRYYLTKGTGPEVLGYYVPPGGVVNNDIIVVAKDAANPVLAHGFINFLFDRENALDNFSYEGYQPPLTGVEESEWLERGFIPENLRTTLVTEQHFVDGRQILELPPEADQLWQDAWAQFKAGVRSS
ncbi:MAG TPA: spermidine/putrescine ABC transporter substrate-binding protein [Actinomycetota bacterium]|nr:spermidine/putrescine ABC transporter substrate-binding protein [Actinomycetota bacterium]